MRPNRCELTELEKDSLVKWIISIYLCKAVPRSATVEKIANILFTTRGINSSPIVDKNWLLKFINRREEIRLYFSKRYDYRHILNKNPKLLRKWFIIV